MRIEKIDLDKVSNYDFINSLDLKYSLEYFNDRVVVSKSFEGISMVDLIEGRYFNEKQELKIFKVNGQYKVILFVEEDTDKVLKVDHLVMDNKFNSIEKIGIKKYMDYDLDGQAFIKCLRPYKLL